MGSGTVEVTKGAGAEVLLLGSPVEVAVAVMLPKLSLSPLPLPSSLLSSPFGTHSTDSMSPSRPTKRVS